MEHTENQSTEFIWGHRRRFNAYSEYFKRTFGERVQKVAVNAGFTCPNRDGSISVGGCIYCDNNAFNPSYCHPSKNIAQQIEEGIEFHKNRYRRANKYLAYFQAFSNTYAPLKTLRERYAQALEKEEIVGLVIGTRPDCMDDEKLDYFSQLSQSYYIIIEYGVESCNNHTLGLINRGHTFEQAVTAIEKTHRAGIKTGAHFIFGLPCETVSEWMQWSGIISELPLDTIKFHQLQIINNTPIATMYKQNPSLFHRFTLEEYIDFIIRFLERLNPRFVVERFAGEVPPRFLEQTSWGWIRNDQILQTIEDKLQEQNTCQGRLFI
ncbi:MAG: TIGR01212 family radical SAM protein [Bacteroidales bacterium]|jgi:radical SAM protein (TIGR01212 family)|nr:TIGR01212 family radical SAM protein [Bacteroidales bacterium]